MATFLTGMRVLVIEQKIGRARREILKKQLEKRGGVVVDRFTEEVTHVIADGSLKYAKIVKLLKSSSTCVPDHVQVVQAEWLSACIIAEDLLSTVTYQIRPPVATSPKRRGQPPTQAGDQPLTTSDVTPASSHVTPESSPAKVN